MRRLEITQTELASRLGVSRVILGWSKSTKPLPGHDYPKSAIGLAKILELARLAGWEDGRDLELAAAWKLDSLWRSGREHLETLRALGPEARALRLRQLAEAAIRQVRKH